MQFEFSADFAKEMDEKDPLKSFRDEFHIPTKNGQEVVYFTGNSLGLQPKKAREIINQELDDWAKFGVDGHFEARNPWFSYHELFTEKTARLVGGLPHEVVMMNGLTTNLHLMMVSFYRPKGKRFKILCEKKAFPSDQYALESQVKFHGYDPKEAIIEIEPDPKTQLVDHNTIYDILDKQGEEIALVMIGGMNYYTGQLFNMETITKAARKVGTKVGFDLAHAAGNVKLNLHEWGVDFACWCTYKYLNSGPGSISGVFVHERHAEKPDLPRFAGWWGHDKSERFQMKPGFKPMYGAEGWQLSNAPVMAMAPHLASLEQFDRAGMISLTEKSKQLTGYLEFVLKTVSAKAENLEIEILTPETPDERGCQLSVFTHGQGKALFDKLTEEGVVADWREPNVIRMAPVPMYNSFMDIYRFGEILQRATAEG
ncbi:kynureninase [Halocola ammonii]